VFSIRLKDPRTRFALAWASLPAWLVLAMIPGLAVADDPWLSEIRIDQPGTDDDEYFELSGDPGAALEGLTYLVIGDGAGGSGVIEAVVDLSGQSVPTNGFFVAVESTFALGGRRRIQHRPRRLLCAGRAG
jgi:hypothetical protein